MLTLTIHITFGKTEINNVYCVTGRFSATNEEVIWFDIAMNNSLSMDLLEMFHKLDRD